MSKQKKLMATTVQACQLIDVNPSTLTRWKKIGVEEAAMISKNMWDLKLLLEWWLENIYLGSDASDTPSITKEKLRYAIARADKMEIQVDTLRGDLKPKDEIHRQWADRMAVVISGLTMYEGRLPPLLEGKTQGEMRAIIKKENHRLRDHYCKAGGR